MPSPSRTLSPIPKSAMKSRSDDADTARELFLAGYDTRGIAGLIGLREAEVADLLHEARRK